MMNHKEQELLKTEITVKTAHIKNLGNWLRNSVLVFLIFGTLGYWGLSGIQDRFLPDITGPGRVAVGWIGSIVGVLALLFAILVYVAIHNGRKHVLQLINTLKGVKK
jgi:hypothetical protein